MFCPPTSFGMPWVSSLSSSLALRRVLSNAALLSHCQSALGECICCSVPESPFAGRAIATCTTLPNRLSRWNRLKQGVVSPTLAYAAGYSRVVLKKSLHTVLCE